MRVDTFKVGCIPCELIVGTVREVEERPGFFRNECSPDPMPTNCLSCGKVLTRL